MTFGETDSVDYYSINEEMDDEDSIKLKEIDVDEDEKPYKLADECIIDYSER